MANVAFGLEMQKVRPEQRRQRVQPRSSKWWDSDGFAHRSLDSLSGGERQRVALARSLAPEPRLLLLDEPLASLDRTLRDRLADEIRSILKTLGITAIFVTHDQSEAFAVADRIAILAEGRLEQFGSPESVYRRPNSVDGSRLSGFSQPPRRQPGRYRTGAQPARQLARHTPAGQRGSGRHSPHPTRRRPAALQCSRCPERHHRRGARRTTTVPGPQLPSDGFAERTAAGLRSAARPSSTRRRQPHQAQPRSRHHGLAEDPQENDMKCTILANGQWSQPAGLDLERRQQELVIATDGGAVHCRALGVTSRSAGRRHGLGPRRSVGRTRSTRR